MSNEYFVTENAELIGVVYGDTAEKAIGWAVSLAKTRNRDITVSQVIGIAKSGALSNFVAYDEITIVGDLEQTNKENKELKEGIKEAVEFIDSTHFWEVNSYNTGEYYMRCRYCLNDYKHGGHHKECVVGMWLERWGE